MCRVQRRKERIYINKGCLCLAGDPAVWSARSGSSSDYVLIFSVQKVTRHFLLNEVKWMWRCGSVSVLPNESLDGGAHHAGEQEEGGDQDVEEGQGGKGHSWGQIGVLRDVNVDHKRLRSDGEERTSWARSQRRHKFRSLNLWTGNFWLADCHPQPAPKPSKQSLQSKSLSFA